MKNLKHVLRVSVNNDWLNKVEITVEGAKFNEDKGMVQIKCIITQDKNDYGNGTTNMFQKFGFYAKGLDQSALPSLTTGKKIKIKNIENISVYGDFKTEVSLVGAVERIYD